MESRRKIHYDMTEEQKKLAADNMALVPFILNEKFGRAMADDEDAVSEGYIALCVAAATYDTTYRGEFSTYASAVIINRAKRLIRTKNMKKRVPDKGIISLDTPVRGMGEDIFVRDTVSASDDTMEDEYVRKERQRHLRRLAAQITEEAPLLARAKSGARQMELAAEQGISFQAVGQKIRRRQKKIVDKYRKEYEKII